MAIMINKTDAAERQLNTAIHLFFENRDHLSSHALAVAAREVTDDLIQRRHSAIYQRELARVGDPLKVRLSYREELKILIKPEFYSDFITIDRKWQNFLKHAKKDPDTESESVTTQQLAVVITWAIKNYALLTQRWTAEMATFFAWFVVAEPQFINSAPKDEVTDKGIAAMRSYILDDPYDRNTLRTIYSAMTNGRRED